MARKKGEPKNPTRVAAGKKAWRNKSAAAKAKTLRALGVRRRRKSGGSRKARCSAAPRRRRYSMKRKRGGGRRKGIKVTPLRIAKAVTVVAGAKMVLDSDIINLMKVHVQNPSQVTGNPTKVGIEYAKRILPGAVVAIVGPKLIEKGVQLLSKGEPALGRVARVKLITV